MCKLCWMFATNSVDNTLILPFTFIFTFKSFWLGRKMKDRRGKTEKDMTEGGDRTLKRGEKEKQIKKMREGWEKEMRWRESGEERESKKVATER